MYEIKVDEPQEERIATILVRSLYNSIRKYVVKEKDIISMTNVLRFIDDSGAEQVYGNTPYEIEFGPKLQSTNRVFR